MEGEPRRKREKKPTNSGSLDQKESSLGSSWVGKKEVGRQQLFGSKQENFWPPSRPTTTQRVSKSGGLNRKPAAKSGTNPGESSRLSKERLPSLKEAGQPRICSIKIKAARVVFPAFLLLLHITSHFKKET